jgi:hypothetical protein
MKIKAARLNQIKDYVGAIEQVPDEAPIHLYLWTVVAPGQFLKEDELIGC